MGSKALFGSTALLVLIVLGCGGLSSVDVETKKGVLSDNTNGGKIDVLTWPRMSSKDFGCWMEEQLGHRDSKFNCATTTVKSGNPCGSTEAYYAGPAFPAAEWESALLRSVTVVLTEKMPAAKARELFGLPATGYGDRDNISFVDVQDCTQADTCLILEGFEHVGAGDAGCP